MSLQDNIVGCWPLTADANDQSPNGLNFTNTGSVPIGVNGAQFTMQPTEYLSRVSSAALETGDVSYALLFKVRFHSLNGVEIVAKYGGFDSAEWEVFLDVGSDRIYLTFPGGDDSFPFVYANAFGNISDHLNEWLTVFTGYNADTDEMFISINGSTETPTVYAGGTPAKNDAPIYIGGTLDSSPSMDADFKHFGYWKGDISELDTAAVAWLRTSWNGSFADLANYPPSPGNSNAGKMAQYRHRRDK